MFRKRNRRVDNLIYVLIDKVQPYFLKKQVRKKCGFHGLDLEEQEGEAARNKAQLIPDADIVVSG